MKKTGDNSCVLQIFASPQWGGGEQYVFDLSRNLLNLDYKIIFVSRKSPDIAGKLAEIGANATWLPMKFLFDIWSIWKLAQIVDRQSVDVVHTHIFKDAFIGLFASKFSRRKPRVVLTRHLVKKAKTGWLYRWLYKRIDKIVFVSHLAQGEFLSSSPSIAASKMEVVHNSVPPVGDDEVAINLREKYGIDKHTTLLAFVGRIVPEKGIEVLIEALRSLSHLDFCLLVAGKGQVAYEEGLKQRVGAYGLAEKVIFVGFVNQVGAFIRETDIGVLPSICRESFGLTVIEFMQAGKPVVATNNGAQVELIEDGRNGILVSPEDVVALKDVIIRLVENPGDRFDLGGNARNTFIEKFAYDVFLEKMTCLYLSAK
jgi:glycosyltransferase involved in cell wall biosynthesis